MRGSDRLTLEEVLTTFDEHLRCTRGVCPGMRRNYARFMRAFFSRHESGCHRLMARALQPDRHTSVP